MFFPLPGMFEWPISAGRLKAGSQMTARSTDALETCGLNFRVKSAKIFRH